MEERNRTRIAAFGIVLLVIGLVAVPTNLHIFEIPHGNDEAYDYNYLTVSVILIVATVYWTVVLSAM